MRTLRLALTLLLGPPLVALAVVCAGVAVAAQWGRVDLGWDIFAHFAHLSLLGGLTAMAAGFAFRGLLRGALLALGLVAVAGSAVLVVPEFLARPARRRRRTRRASSRSCSSTPGQATSTLGAPSTG